MNGAVKAARHMEDFRPFPPPSYPPSLPPIDRPMVRPRDDVSQRPKIDPRTRTNRGIPASSTGSSTRYRNQEPERRREGHVRRRHERSPDYYDDSGHSSDGSHYTPRRLSQRDPRVKANVPGPTPRGIQTKSAGPSGDPSARRKQLDEHFKQPEKSDLVKKLESAITPLRVGILLGCFDLIGGTMTIWMTKRRNAKEKEAEAEKLALAAQAAEGAGEEPAAPRGWERRERNRSDRSFGSSNDSHGSRRGGDVYRRRDLSDSDSDGYSEAFARRPSSRAKRSRR